MSHIEWNDDTEIGIEEIDGQHYNLARIINAVEDLKGEGNLRKNANKATYTLLSFAKFHFAAEEALMMKYGYPGYTSQKAQHDKLISRISSINEKVEKGQNVDFYEVYNFLNEWFVNHTKSYDRKYVPFFAEKGAILEEEKPAEENEPKKCRLKTGLAAFIEWLPEYEFGITDIDEQHKSLVIAINMLYMTMNKPNQKAKVEEAFKELNRYTTLHFNREEGLMEKYHYPDLIIHKMEHEDFRQQIKQIKKKFDRFKTVVDHDLIVMLRDWFINHAQTEDRKYLEYVKIDEIK